MVQFGGSHKAMVSVSQHELLRHWLAHYGRLGIDLRRRATLVL